MSSPPPTPPSPTVGPGVPTLDPNNPLLARLQTQLETQLTSAISKVEYDIGEKEEELRMAKERRETLGVSLYGVQQQLAKLQLSSELTLENAHTMAALREEAEALRDATRAEYEEDKGEEAALGAELAAFTKQLDAVNAMLGEIDLYNDELKASIAVTRRAAYKAEEDIQGLEKEKLRQDLQIDSLNEQLKRLQDEEALFEAQLISQSEETVAATGTLAEASAEMEEIEYEKKGLVSQWNAALRQMQARDEALVKLEEELEDRKNALRNMDNEIAGLRKLIREESDTNEKLTGIKKKAEAELRFLVATMDELEEKHAKGVENYNILVASLERTEAELTEVNASRAKLLTATRGLQREADAILETQHAYEDEMEANGTQQVTLSKGAQATAKATKKLTVKLRELEREQIKNENELARIRMDILNTEDHNGRLKETLEGLVGEMRDLEGLINNYEVEIRRRNDSIQKKQSEVDRLNKLYDSLASNMVDENTGPLEATIHNLSKSIQGAKAECTRLQNYWLRQQRTLVNNEKAAAEQATTLAELRAQLTVLQQKKLRLDSVATGHNAECSEYEKQVRAAQRQLAVLNESIAQNEDAQARLAEANLSQENAFIRKLQDAEKVAIGLEVEIDELLSEKKYLLSDVIEAERQIMLWEKKIQLAKETQEALDPEVGATEVKAMKKEIHRMKLRHASLLRQQEKMVQDMEKAIVRREHIWARGRAVQKKAASSKSRSAAAAAAVSTKASIQKALATLDAKIRAATADVETSDAELRALGVEQDSSLASIQETQDKVASLTRQADELAASRFELAFTRERNVLNLSRLQRLTKRYAAVEESKYKLTKLATSAPDALSDAILSEQNKRSTLGSVLSSVKSVLESQHARQQGLAETRGAVDVDVVGGGLEDTRAPPPSQETTLLLSFVDHLIESCKW